MFDHILETDLPQILMGELDKTKEMFFAWFKVLKHLVSG